MRTTTETAETTARGHSSATIVANQVTTLVTAGVQRTIRETTDRLRSYRAGKRAPNCQFGGSWSLFDIPY